MRALTREWLQKAGEVARGCGDVEPLVLIECLQRQVKRRDEIIKELQMKLEAAAEVHRRDIMI